MKRSRTEELLQHMADAPVEVDDAQAAAARRERVVGRLAVLHGELLAERETQHRRWRSAGVLAVAAVSVLAVGTGWYAVRANPGAGDTVDESPIAHLEALTGSVELSREGKARPARVDQRLADQDQLHTGKAGRATVRLASGAEVAVGSATRLTLHPAADSAVVAESLDLGLGEVRVHVPKLSEGGSFRVKAPDALVEVHGTRFSVLVVEDASGTATRVAVSEGLVSVLHEGKREFLGVGAVWWSRQLQTAQRVAPSPDREARVGEPEEASAKHSAPVPAEAKVASTLPSKTSSLAAQNRLFQSAMDARRRGDDQRAVQLIDTLLAKYPGSPFEQEARVERFRALERLGKHAEAARAARRYLADHPEGFAGDEARDVVLKPDSTKP